MFAPLTCAGTGLVAMEKLRRSQKAYYWEENDGEEEEEEEDEKEDENKQGQIDMSALSNLDILRMHGIEVLQFCHMQHCALCYVFRI